MIRTVYRWPLKEPLVYSHRPEPNVEGHRCIRCGRLVIVHGSAAERLVWKLRTLRRRV